MANSTRRSIELEPKTLCQGQLSQARKVAADVVQKMVSKEASPLFTKGLEHSVEEEETDVDEEEEEEVEEEKVEKIEIIEEKGACNISVYPPLMVDSPSSDNLHIHHQHEPLSAPF